MTVKGQIVVKTCQSGLLKTKLKSSATMANKKLIATTVSSREKATRRREEGRTTGSQKTISLQRNQGEGRDKLMKVNDDSPTLHEKQQKQQ